MKRLIIRNLKKRKAQVISMTATIAICAMVFVTLFLLYGGMQRGVTLNEQRGGADVVVVPSDASQWVSDKEMLFTGAPVSSYVDASLVDKIAQINGVERVTAQFYGHTLAAACCSTGTETRIIGFDPETDWVVLPYADTKVTKLEEGQIIAGCYVNDYDKGDGKLLGTPVTVVAHLEPTGSSLDFSVLMDIDQVRSMAASNESFNHFWEVYGQPQNLVSAILVDLEDDAVPSIVNNEIRKLGGVSIIERAAVVEDTQETLNVVFMIMLAAGIFLGIASLLQFVARYVSSVWERKAELALYRALGATIKKLKIAVCGEAFVITGIGCAIGIVLGIALYAAAYAYLQSVQAFPFAALEIWQAILGIIAIVVVFFVVAVLSIIAPLKQVAKVDPASAMQQVDIG